MQVCSMTGFEGSKCYGICLDIVADDLTIMLREQAMMIAEEKLLTTIAESEGYTCCMPCGEVYEMRPGDPLPEVDLPCPCGSSDHWLFARRFEQTGSRVAGLHIREAYETPAIIAAGELEVTCGSPWPTKVPCLDGMPCLEDYP